MADIGELASIIGGTATGGVLGGVLSMGGRVADFFIEKEQAKSALESKKVDYAQELAVLDRTQDRERQKHVEEAAIEKLRGELELMKESYQGLRATVADQSKMVEANHALAWVRPGLSAFLILSAFIMAFVDNINPFYQFSSMASMAVAWWFGDRQFNKNASFRANK